MAEARGGGGDERRSHRVHAHCGGEHDDHGDEHRRPCRPGLDENMRQRRQHDDEQHKHRTRRPRSRVESVLRHVSRGTRVGERMAHGQGGGHEQQQRPRHLLDGLVQRDQPKPRCHHHKAAKQRH